MVNLQKKSSDKAKQNAIDQGKEFGYNSQDTKAFLKVVLADWSYKVTYSFKHLYFLFFFQEWLVDRQEWKQEDKVGNYYSTLIERW